ncbi:hypothetical protein [Arthrobacter sp. ISL-28]|uniref:hypothetical protein n=1 Tax=Arthrobacter sp. ISL-28 TaxID=2819108 RepID=UPI0020355DEE|nr:hypothetical protein [Arthrobacter sp. ISL-28]
MVGINSDIISDVAVPLGGVKASRIGREGGVRGIDESLSSSTRSTHTSDRVHCDPDRGPQRLIHQSPTTWATRSARPPPPPRNARNEEETTRP